MAVLAKASVGRGRTFETDPLAPRTVLDSFLQQGLILLDAPCLREVDPKLGELRVVSGDSLESPGRLPSAAEGRALRLGEARSRMRVFRSGSGFSAPPETRNPCRKKKPPVFSVGEGSPEPGNPSPELGNPSPELGNPSPRVGGSLPRVGGPLPRAGGPLPRAGGPLPHNGLRLPGGGDTSPRVTRRPGER